MDINTNYVSLLIDKYRIYGSMINTLNCLTLYFVGINDQIVFLQNPIGHYEWLIMPFSLKNTLSIFQRKMDHIFGQLDYVLVYIDDILIASHTLQEHYKYVENVLQLCITHGIILSKKKIEIAKEYINFLGQKIGKGEIELQDHIIKKVLDFPDKLEDTKELQKFLGLLNYAPRYIKDLGKIIKSLYKKTSTTGQKYFNQEDIKIIQKIKEQVKHLPKLTLSLEIDYKIVIVDASQDGWGAELKVKPYKEAFQNTAKLCRYVSGNFRQLPALMTLLDFEILGVINALHAFKLFLQKDFTIRTDCEAIVYFYKNKNEKKIYSKRWVNFITTIEGNGYNVTLEHIKEKNNFLTDFLSQAVKYPKKDLKSMDFKPP